jgi:hypothetical protein
MTTAKLLIAHKDALSEAMCWTGSDASFSEIKHWAGDGVKAVGDALYFQADDHVEELPVGHYLVNINGHLCSFSPGDMKDYRFCRD